ncbi:MAG: DUF2184 domain-containing protein [Bacteroidia bacterium]
MPVLAPAFVTVNPSFTEPGLLLPYSQASGAFSLLAGGKPRASLGEGDLAVYIKKIDLRTSVAANQAAANQLPSLSAAFSQISTPTYLLRCRGEWDHHDAAASDRWGAAITEIQRLGMRQGIFQQMRGALLDGFRPAQGEGLLNVQGATAINLPADSNGATTLATYDNGELAFFMISLVQAMKTRTNQMGKGVRFCFTGPQRALGPMTYQDIVQLTQFQRVGAGTANTKELLESVLSSNGDQLDWCYDDTLQGKGAGGADAIILTMPEVEKPSNSGPNTNEFAKLAPGLDATTLQYCDMAAPREITSPLAGGAIDQLSELRVTSGWGVRPQAVTVLSAFSS